MLSKVASAEASGAAALAEPPPLVTQAFIKYVESVAPVT
jgi:hypothetical protein